MNIVDDEFPALFGLIGAYLHQDMDIEYDGVPEALAAYSNFTPESRKQQLRQDMKNFLERYHNDAEGEFFRRYGREFSPDMIGQTVPEFFDMLRTILDDPESYVRFEPNN